MGALRSGPREGEAPGAMVEGLGPRSAHDWFGHVRGISWLSLAPSHSLGAHCLSGLSGSVRPQDDGTVPGNDLSAAASPKALASQSAQTARSLALGSSAI